MALGGPEWCSMMRLGVGLYGIVRRFAEIMPCDVEWFEMVQRGAGRCKVMLMVRG